MARRPIVIAASPSLIRLRRRSLTAGHGVQPQQAQSATISSISSISTRNAPPIQAFRQEQSTGIPAGTFKQRAKDVLEDWNIIAETNVRCTLQ